MIARRRAGLGMPMGVSAVAHIGALALLIVVRGPKPTPMPTMYRVNIIAAPPGPRAIGVVTPPDVTPPPPATPTTPPRRAEVKPNEMPSPAKPKPAPRTPPAPATPNATTAKAAPNALAPKAGGGETGDRGTDVATVRTEGIAFPYQSYVDNIVRQIALNFKPKNANASLRADVFFIIHRDGSVTGIRLVSSSPSYAFNLEAVGAVEAAGATKAFGALPEGFSEPSLPVTFSFDPQRLR